METIKILSTRGDVLFQSKEALSLAEAVEQAVSLSVSLVSADLRGAALRGANLSNASLRGAELQGADLGLANLQNANLFGANLREAKLLCANLWCAGLRGAELENADLGLANLQSADLFGANLQGANLWGANLWCADLRNANLDKVSTDGYTNFFESLCPSEGSFVGWKRAGNHIVKLLITEDSKRSSATSLKCRCSKAEVLDIQGMKGKSLKNRVAVSNYDRNFTYRVGKIVEVEDFDEDRWNECSTGIHFFMSRNNAVNYR